MKKLFFTISAITAVLFFTSCMLLNPPEHNSHTVTISLPAGSSRFATGTEALDYTNFYQVRLYQYQNGAIMSKPYLTKVLPAGEDISFTADTGYYYLELDAWAENTGTVVTAKGSTLTTEYFFDELAGTTVPGVFDLSPDLPEDLTLSVPLVAVSDSQMPKWNINWVRNGGNFIEGFNAPETFTWKTMYTNPRDLAESTLLPDVTELEKEKSVFAGWYMTSDFTGEQIIRMSQLPLQNIILYAKWNPATEIGAEYDSFNAADFSLECTHRSDLIQEFEVTASGITDGVTIQWYINGEKQDDITGTRLSYTAEETGIYTITCVVTDNTGHTAASESIDVIIEELDDPEYTVSFVLNDGSFTEYESDYFMNYTWTTWESFSHGILPTSEELEKELSIFNGWYLTADFTGTPVTSCADLPKRQSVTLYAKWRDATGIGADIEVPETPGEEFELRCDSSEANAEKFVEADATGNSYAWYVDGALQSSDGHHMTFTATPGLHTVVCIMTKDGVESTSSITVTYIPN